MVCSSSKLPPLNIGMGHNMSNTYLQLKTLLNPLSPIYRVKVLALNADGVTSSVQFPGTYGPIINVRGQSVSVGQFAFIQAGEIRQAAPSLPVSSISI